MKYTNLLPRFIDYVKKDTRSDEESTTVPSTPNQTKFLLALKKEIEDLGLTEVELNPENSYLTATIPATSEDAVKIVGFLSHVDTADFNSVGISPQIIKNYDGKSPIALGETDFNLNTTDFPSLKKYAGQTLVTTDGTTLLGSDDKSGVAAIVTFAEYLMSHPEIKHGKIRLGFGPDEEIGTGADKFDTKGFAADFAYTIDGGPVGQLEYETFNAAALKVSIQGKNIHPGEAKGKMISAIQLAIDFQNHLPEDERADTTDKREGFYQLMNLNGTIEDASFDYIIRDFERSGLEARKANITKIAAEMNSKFDKDRIKIDMYDQYYNMIDVIQDNMEIVELAEQAMKNVGITPDEEPVRGGTDGSKISFMGLPTPNIFAGGENMHGRYEYVALESMEKAVDVLLEIIALNNFNSK